jgi:hypothetical protein
VGVSVRFSDGQRAKCQEWLASRSRATLLANTRTAEPSSLARLSLRSSHSFLRSSVSFVRRAARSNSFLLAASDSASVHPLRTVILDSILIVRLMSRIQRPLLPFAGGLEPHPGYEESNRRWAALWQRHDAVAQILYDRPVGTWSQVSELAEIAWLHAQKEEVEMGHPTWRYSLERQRPAR